MSVHYDIAADAVRRGLFSLDVPGRFPSTSTLMKESRRCDPTSVALPDLLRPLNAVLLKIAQS